MGRIFEKAADYTDFSNKTFGDALQAAKAHTPDLTWQELAQFNWATKEGREVNRQLVERIGCKTVDDADPAKTAFDTDRGPGGAPTIALPKLVKVALEGGKTHTVKLKQKRPAPAIGITKLTRWFLPEKEACTIQYGLEGIQQRAEFVDLEVHAQHYFQADKGGGLTPSKTRAEEGSTDFFSKPKLFSVTTPKAPPDLQDFNTWKGESEATEGVLKKDSSAVYINYQCAPYTVQFRFYKNTADAKAKLVLDCFCPKWQRPASKGATPLIDPASLVAKWKITGDNGKLKQGQLILWDKDDKEVLRIGLSGSQVTGCTFDFAPKWKALFDRKLMPYRLQVQAHSDDTVDEGLALAVMHTQVKAFLYDEIQCVAFNIKPGTTGTTPNKYLGVDDPVADIKKRCEITIAAMKQASTMAVEKAENVLKLFMAPEFYFRGQRGAYPFDQIDSIPTQLLVEAQKFEYADWLFVYGTAIGALEHQEGMAPIQHGAAPYDMNEHPVTLSSVADDPGTWIVAGCPDSKVQQRLFDKMEASLAAGVKWQVRQDTIDLVQESGKDDRWNITLDTAPVEVTAFEKSTGKVTLKTRKVFDRAAANKPVFLLEPVAWVTKKEEKTGKTVITVRSAIAGRIPAGEVRWKAIQGGVNGEIASTNKLSNGVYELTCTANPAFVVGPVSFEEPVTAEVMNVAMIQKGWPANYPCKRELKRAVVYKEYVSAIDFLSTYFGKHSEFHEITGLKRLIDINGKTDVRVLPTSGSIDVMGASPNPIGGTDSWTDPQGEKHIIGSEINKSGEGGGSVITVDGITFGVEVCLDHAKNKLSKFYNGKAASGDPKVQVQLIPSWGMSIGGGDICTVDRGLIFNVDGARCDSMLRLKDGTTYSCDTHGSRTGTSAVKCGEFGPVKEMYVCKTCHAVKSSSPGKCTTHTTEDLVHMRQCWKCNNFWEVGAGNCTCTLNDGRTKCQKNLQPIGPGIAATSGKTPVPEANAPTYYQEPGHLLLYPKQKIPDPEYV